MTLHAMELFRIFFYSITVLALFVCISISAEPTSKRAYGSCESTLATREIEILTTNDKYWVRDRAFPYFRAEAVVENGVLHLEVVTKDKNGNRSSNIFGSEEFKRIIEHFEGRFHSIQGDWIFGDNLNTVNEWTRNTRITLREAIKHTWTAKQAAAIGYDRFKVVEKMGSRGNYSDLTVLFFR